MGDRRRQVPRGSRRQLDDRASASVARSLGGPAERRVRRPPGLVRKRHMNVGAGRESLQQTPLGHRQILEAVGEHRASLPRIEIACQSIDCAAPQCAAIPPHLRIKQRSILASEARRAARPASRGRASHPRARRAHPRASPRNPGKRSEAQGAAESTVAIARRTSTVRAASPIGRFPRPSPVANASKRRSNVPIVPASRPPGACDQLPFDHFDIRLVRNDQPGIAIEELEIALVQERHLAGMCRPDYE